MPFYRNISCFLILVASWLVVSLPIGPVQAAPSLFTDYKGVVAIDAGHGGKDVGAKSDGNTEKEICLTITRRLTDLMEPDYRIVLTRSGDYDISLTERSAVANNQKADLLISLHTAAGFMRTANGMTVYYYQPASKGSDQPAPSGADMSPPIPWHDLQLRHLTASRQLAQQLRQAIEIVTGVPEVKVVQAPLAVLEGADMPAVLIEMGYLTNPADEKRLVNPEQQSLLAQAIMRGVESYLSSK